MSIFIPTGTPLAFTGATTAPTSVQPSTSDNVSNSTYRAINESATIACVIGFGSTDTIAKANAAAANASCVVCPAFGVIDFVAPYGSFFSGITPSSTAVIYIQTGMFK